MIATTSELDKMAMAEQDDCFDDDIGTAFRVSHGL